MGGARMSTFRTICRVVKNNTVQSTAREPARLNPNARMHITRSAMF